MANGDTPLDASNITRRLWVGSRPPFDRDLPDFDVLVLCAEELQPRQVAFHGKVIRAPIPDATLTNRQIVVALQAAKQLAMDLKRGKRALVTCAAGINRSALVAGLALAACDRRITAPEIVHLMRSRRRAECLYNLSFQDVLAKYMPPRM